MTVAFVMSGGASLGAVQVGMVRALVEADIHPQLLVGASVGAMNASWLAGHGDKPDMDIAGLASFWKGLTRSDVFPLEFVGGLMGFVGKRTSLLSDHGLRNLLEQSLTFERIEDAFIPLAVIATDVLNGELVVLEEGPAEPAIRASASIPAVFPPVRHRGRWLMDGGVASNTPIATAAAKGATDIYVLPAQTAGEQKLPSNAIGMAVNAVSLLIDARMKSERAELPAGVSVTVLEPAPTEGVSPVDFSKTEMLIEAGYVGGTACLRAKSDGDLTLPK